MKLLQLGEFIRQGHGYLVHERKIPRMQVGGNPPPGKPSGTAGHGPGTGGLWQALDENSLAFPGVVQKESLHMTGL